LIGTIWATSKRTGERGYRHDHQARKHGAGFAEHVAHGAEHGLHQRIGQREGSREQSHGFHRLRQVGRDLRNNRVDSANKQAA
jgi:hypothetical protein